ncbi:MAG: UDP-N-acetylglucosamine 1-carboxyvinyltransferase [Clostridia bacterium]|nr:UDP-N-acetylglucosamine 1-carboxyvinyltransferase [Clostridia bacterium]
MSSITVFGSRPLIGQVNIQGAKNSVLPILAACLLCRSACTIHNCPYISDVDACLRILKHLGCKITRQGQTVVIDPDGVCCSEIPQRFMREMRSSIVFLGAVLGKCGRTVLSLPGGCELGPRPIDLHLAGLSQLGVGIQEKHGEIHCQVQGSTMVGGEIVLPIPSVGATENIMIAACVAKGQTIIRNAAKEPEIVDLACFLNRCGAKIRGYGESSIVIEGVKELHGCEHRVIPDRIVLTTYMSAVAVSGGEADFLQVNPHHVCSTLPFFRRCGCKLTVSKDRIHIKAPKRPERIGTIVTGYYPGFPTDAQPVLMALVTIAKGTNIFVENIFENRYHHVQELIRLGANIRVEGRMAVVEGVDSLTGTQVKAADLRGGAALLVAGLCAEGCTKVQGVEYIARGYEDIVRDLTMLGAKVRK